MGILIWLFLTLFSLFGYLGIIDFVENIFGSSDTVSAFTFIINFYLSNLLAMILFRKNPIMLFNRGLILLITGLSLLVGEITLVWYVIFVLFDANEGFWSFTFFFFGFLTIVSIGGIRQILVKLLNDLQLFFELFFEGLKKNTINRALKKANVTKYQKNKNSKKKNKVNNEKNEYDFYNY